MNNSGTIKSKPETNPGMILELDDGRTIQRNWNRNDDPPIIKEGQTIEWSTWGDFNPDEWFDKVRIL